MKVELNPQRCDMAGELCERLPVGEVTELQNMMNSLLTDEEFCEFLAEEVGEFPGLQIVESDEMWDRFCSPMVYC